MKSIIFPLVAVLCFGFAARAQTPIPTPESDSDQVVRISTSLVQMDVSVTDKDGKPISDISQDEIQVYQNDKKQEITNFSFVSGGNFRNVKNGRVPDGALLDSNVKPEDIRRTIVVVIDDLSLSFENTFWAKKAVKTFIESQMQQGDLVAIIRTSAGIGSLQQFTTDKRRLLAAADKIRYNSITAQMSLFYPVATATNGTREPKRTKSTDPERDRFRENVFASGSLGALNYVIKGMRELPGRKSIMLISEGVPLFFVNTNKIPELTQAYSNIKRLIDLANRASVVIYGIDPSGLTIPGAVPTAFWDRDRTDSLRMLSQQTGGFAVVNQNDINRGMARVLQDQSYYLVGYQPDDDTFNAKIPKYNQVRVTVSRPGAEVRYRSGFMGFSEETINAAAPTGKQKMIKALLSPFGINEITLDLNTLVGADGDKRPFLRPVIHVGPGDLTFREQPDGKYKASFDLVAMTFGESGQIIDQSSQEFTVDVDRDEYDAVSRNGFVYEFILKLRSAGAYQTRVVIRDHVTDRVGSASRFVDVPNFKKGRLLVSSPFLENVSRENWEKAQAGLPPDPNGTIGVWRATATREFEHDTVLKFAYSIFNARLDAQRNAHLHYQVKLFRNGEPVYTGTQMPLSVKDSADYRSLDANGKIVLSPDFEPGDYILQLTITDELRKGSKGIVDQFIQFEIVE